MTDRMMDRLVREGINDAIRFLQPGASYDCEVDDHAIVVVRLEGRADSDVFLVACRTCARFCGEHILRRVYPTIHKHTEAPCPTK